MRSCAKLLAAKTVATNGINKTRFIHLPGIKKITHQYASIARRFSPFKIFPIKKDGVSRPFLLQTTTNYSE
jgi:hypothetical protein